MKMRMNHLGIVGMAIALLIANLSFGQPSAGDPNNPPEMREAQPPHHTPILRGLHLIDLTDEQKEQIETILEDNKDGVEAAHAAVKAAQEAMASAVESEDEDAIILAAADLGSAIGDAALTRLSVVKAIKSVLTEEQLTELAELKEKAEQWMQDGMFDRGPKGGRRGGPQGGPMRQGPEPPQDDNQ